MRAQTEVRTGAAEPHVGIRVAQHVEGFRGVEHTRIAVRDAVEQYDLVAFEELLRRQCHAPCRRASHERHRRRDSNDLLHRSGCHRAEIGLPASALIRVLRQQVHAMADGGPRRVVACDREQDEERGDLVTSQRLLVILGIHERRDEIVGRLAAPQLGELVDERRELHTC